MRPKFDKHSTIVIRDESDKENYTTATTTAVSTPKPQRNQYLQFKQPSKGKSKRGKKVKKKTLFKPTLKLMTNNTESLTSLHGVYTPISKHAR